MRDNKITRGYRIHGSGQIVREYKTLRSSKSMCRGCYDDAYNYRGPGIEGCWSFASARVVDKVGHSSIYVQNGPDTRLVKTLSCWHAVSK
jgi:hypothetical protein